MDRSWTTRFASLFVVASMATAMADSYQTMGGSWGPVDLASGQLSLTWLDLSVKGVPRSFTMRRAYSPAEGWIFLAEQRAEIDTLSGDVRILFDHGRVTYAAREGGGYVTGRGESLVVDGGAVTYTAPDLTVFHYSAAHGGLETITDPFSRLISFSYDTIQGEQRLVRVDDEAGRSFDFVRDPATGLITALSFDNDGTPVTIAYDHDTEGRLTRVTDAEGNPVDYGYDTEGRLASRTNRLGALFGYGYDSEGRVSSLVVDGSVTLGTLRYIPATDPPKIGIEKTEVIDAYGGKWLFGFNGEGRLLGARNPAGFQIRQTWQGTRRSTRTDELGHKTKYSYEWDGAPQATVHPDGTIEFWKHDPVGLLVASGIYDPVADDTLVTRYGYDADRLRISEQDADGNTQTFSYDDGLLDRRTRRNGTSVEYRYDDAGRVTRETDGTGAATFYTYDDYGNVVEVEDPERNRTEYQYDLCNRLVRRETEDRAVTEWNYGASSLPLTMTDAEGGVTSYGYDTRGNRVSTSDPGGALTTSSYDAYGHQLTFTNKLGATTTSTYDALGRLASRLHHDGASESFVYDGAGNLVQETRRGGAVYSYGYDSRGNRISTIDPLGNLTQRGYDGRGNLVSRIDAAGNTTAHSYTRVAYPRAGYRVLTTTNALGEITSFHYDEEGFGTGNTAHDGAQVVVSNDEEGRITGMIDPLGETRRLTRDGNGNIEFLTNWNGYWSTFAYDRMQRLAEVVDPVGIGNRYAFEYDLLGRVIEMEDPSQGRTEYEYDAVGNLLREIDELGAETVYTYDAAGNRSTRTDALGNTVSWTYDPTSIQGRFLVSSFTDELGATTLFGRDAAGNIVARTEPGGAFWSYSYDALGRVATTTDPLGNLTHYYYDSGGHLTTLMNAGGAAVGYEYDALGRLASVIDALGNITTCGYDVRGALLQVDWPDGSSTTWTRDLLSRALTRTDPGGVLSSFTFDPVGNIVEAVTGAGVEEYVYDRLNRPIEIADGATGLSLQMEISPEGQVLSISDALGGVSSYDHDGADRLVQALSAGGFNLDYSRDLLGRVTEIVASDGTQSSFGYDARGALTQVTHSALAGDLASYTYSYDLDGNVAQVVEEIDGDLTTIDYAYDALGRLIAESYDLDPATNATYTYDAVGNRVSRVRDGQTTLYVYDAADRLLTAGDEQLDYDQRGRLVSRERPGDGGPTTFDYHAAGPLASIAAPGGDTWSFGYNSGGLLRSATDPSAVTTLFQHAMDHVVGEYDEAGVQLGGYLLDPERVRVVATELDSAATRHLYDGLGSVGLVEEAGVTSAAFGYAAFGEARFAQEAGRTGEALRFTGARFLSGPNLYLYRMRPYDPELGRYLTANPALELPSLVSHKIEVQTRGLITSPGEFVAARIARDPLDVELANIEPEFFNQYAYSLNNPASFRSAVGIPKLERDSVEQNPWKWYLLRP